MGYYDAYRAILSTQQSSSRDSRISLAKRVIASGFKDSPSYYNVGLFVPSTPLTSTSADVWILDDSELLSKKVVIAIPGQNVDVGYLYFWNEGYWLTIQNDYQLGDIYDRGILMRCYDTIKWLDANGVVRKAWYCLKSDTASNSGVQDGQILNMPNERRQITIQSNEFTNLIKKEKRFIVEGRTWRTVSINKSIQGIITLTIEETFSNSANDNFDLGIADYYDRVANYQIVINNGRFITIADNQTLQFNAEVTNNGFPITSPELTYQSSDTSIATISPDGLLNPITSGLVTITIFYKDVTETVQVSITKSTAYSYTCEILGPNEIKVGKFQTYTFNFYRNGVKYPDTSRVSLTTESGLPTALATIIEHNDELNTTTIKAGSLPGYLILRLENDNGLATAEMKIRIKSLY